MITADTITDEQIRDLRDRALSDIDHENWWWNQHAYLATPTSQKTHDDIIKAHRETVAICASALNAQCYAERRHEARTRCAEMLNARSGR